jgi:hypothetical protein
MEEKIDTPSFLDIWEKIDSERLALISSNRSKLNPVKVTIMEEKYNDEISSKFWDIKENGLRAECISFMQEHPNTLEHWISIVNEKLAIAYASGAIKSNGLKAAYEVRQKSETEKLYRQSKGEEADSIVGLWKKYKLEIAGESFVNPIKYPKIN